MTYNTLMYLHLATVIPCIFLGAVALFIKKGTKAHKIIGKIYGVLMLITAFVALFLPAQIGPKLFNHFGFIHSFCFLTLYSIPTSILAIKKGKIKKHQRKMIILYVGAILIAGSLALLAPGRYLHELFF